MKKYLTFFGCYIYNFILHIFCLFPIKRNRIIFIAYFGRSYACNPRYISEYIQKKFGDKLEIIWAFREPEKFQELKNNGIILCKCRSLAYYYYRMTSMVVVHNSTIGAEVPIRRKQCYIQTWHGSGAYKSNVKQRRNMYECLVDNRIRKTFQKNTYVMASCKSGEQKTFVDAMGYHGKVIGGMPRMDMLINGDRLDLKKKVREQLGLDEECKVILYAPTWRNNCAVDDYGINYLGVKNAMEQRFGGNWIVLRRMHHYSVKGALDLPEGVMDVTNYPDMQELLVTVDAVISDYSSTLWDFSFTGKPCFQYCPDLEEYQSSRGISTNIYNWGFPLAITNEEMKQNILDFDKIEFAKRMEQHHCLFGSYETGHATEDVCKIITELCIGV